MEMKKIKSIGHNKCITKISEGKVLDKNWRSIYEEGSGRYSQDDGAWNVPQNEVNGSRQTIVVLTIHSLYST